MIFIIIIKLKKQRVEDKNKDENDDLQLQNEKWIKFEYCLF